MELEGPRRLVVYQRSVAAVGALEEIARAIPGDWKDLRDQLRRAASSIPLNLAEGAGEVRSAEKARFYRMARRSAWECVAILDVLNVLGTTIDAEDAHHRLAKVSGMISSLLKSVEKGRA